MDLYCPVMFQKVPISPASMIEWQKSWIYPFNLVTTVANEGLFPPKTNMEPENDGF